MAPSWVEKFIVRDTTTPDSQMPPPEHALKLEYCVHAEHERTLTVVRDQLTRYVIKRIAKLGGAWGDVCHIYSPADGGREVGSLDFRSIPPSIEIVLARDGRKRKIKTLPAVREYEALSGVGPLHWKPIGMEPYGSASWELRSSTDLILVASINGNQTRGYISLFKKGLEEVVIEELLVVGIAQIEEYKRFLRVCKRSLFVAMAT
ncbi:hypothetical protein FAUST_11101 [Fusarium austroamericanum]|uniref:Uncharacterized protein n=1 Tax=Fusarium austroamericanum TaxID=282268 RepID=A0AAN5Z0H2_FUSAU|nr:hypothetical protein FAUST_11101 [Fusarium austroamericanum]